MRIDHVAEGKITHLHGKRAGYIVFSANLKKILCPYKGLVVYRHKNMPDGAELAI